MEGRKDEGEKKGEKIKSRNEGSSERTYVEGTKKRRNKGRLKEKAGQ